MNVQADTVPGAVRKIFAAAVPVEIVAGNCVNIARVFPVPQGLDGQVMGLFDKVVELFLSRVRLCQ